MQYTMPVRYKSATLLSLIAMHAIVTVQGQQAVARQAADCGLLMNKIYCFGGIAAVGSNTETDNSINMLDLAANNGQTADSLQNKWVTVNPDTNGVNTQPRADAQTAVLPDGKRFLMSGGYSTSPTPIADQTIVYDASKNQWSKFDNFVDGSFGNRQIYFGSAVSVPSLGIGFYGGMEQNINRNWTIPGTSQNLTNAEFNSATFRTIGYPQMTFFNTDTARWNVPESQSNVPTTYSVHQTSVYDAVSKNVYFFGGESHNLSDPNYLTFKPDITPFSSSLVYNTVTGAWSNQTWTGASPGVREFHTTTLLTSTNRDILLFGGEDNGKAVADYCYILNLDTKQWTQKSIGNAPQGAILARTRHSTVLVDNSTAFVVFGLSSSNVATSDILMLNVTDPSSDLTLYTNYTTNLSAGNNATVPTGENNTNKGLSTGAKAGIAIGCIIAALLAIGTFVFFCVKKRRERNRRQFEKTQKDQQDEHTIEPMEVDWDELENKFMEVPNPYQSSATDDSQTLRNNESFPTGSGIRTAHAVVPDGGEGQQKPDVIDDDRPFSRIQKPDSGRY